jgi:poly(3-hydroxybutyrate) depolymerase
MNEDNMTNFIKRELRSLCTRASGATMGAATAVTFVAALSVACSSDEPADGAGGEGGTSPNVAGQSGSAGIGGSTGGTGGTGGTPSVGGRASAGTGGSASGSGGSSASGGTAGTGGSASGSGGRAMGGREGGAGRGAGGADGGAGAGMGGAGGAGGASAGSGSGGSGGATPSTGCGKAPPNSDRYSIDVGGEMRDYILAVPEGYDMSKPYRLVFGWHPWGGSAQQVAGSGANGYYGLQTVSDGQAIFVAPEGLDFGGNGKGWGNEGGKDIAFLEAMLAKFTSEMCIDEDRIFSTGFSFGGMFSFASGCSPTGMMRAVAPMAGNISVAGCENGDRPVALMGFHGDDDTVVAIDGGRAGRDKFVERNGCTSMTTPVTGGWCDGVQASNEPCMCVSYEGCMDGYPVIWCEFNGPHTPAPNSGATIWNFFAQF